MKDNPDRSSERPEEPASEGAGEPASERPRKPKSASATATSISEWAEGKPLAPDMHLVLGLGLPSVLLCISMWRLHAYTVDDAYISYRYAKHLAGGLGLVFNEGERIEGYTNFLFTCLLALAIKLGLDPDRTAKVVGALSALGSLACTYGISARLSPLRAVPAISTWLLAGSMVTAGYAVFGLETSFFVCFLLLATWLFLRERERPKAFPWSGAALAVAGLTRPEAPMFAGILMLFLASPKAAPGAPVRFLKTLAAPFGKQNLLRAALFVVPVAAHLVFRKVYYGAWLPNTFVAKTGDLTQQLYGGAGYLANYVKFSGPFLFLSIGGVWLAIAQRRGELAAMAAVCFCVLVYVVLVGGDWMPYYRFFAAFEPFCFLLIDVAVRELVEAKTRWLNVAIGVFAVYTAWSRGRAFSDGARAIDADRAFWTSATGGVAQWFAEHGERGTIAVADMGYIAYATDYPILDLLGLVDPVISTLPGGYTNKTGKGYVERVFQVKPRYFVLVGSADNCDELPFPAQARLKIDLRFRRHYQMVGGVRHSRNGLWCIFGRKTETVP